MSKEAAQGGIFNEKLWSATREREQRPDEKILPLKSPALDERAYVAFDLRDRAERMQIQRSSKPSRFPAYSYLLDISYDHHFQAAFTLIYTFMIVEVTGSNLGRIVHAINFGNCECIREFHSQLYDQPAKDEPFIEKIEITSADEKLNRQTKG